MADLGWIVVRVRMGDDGKVVRLCWESGCIERHCELWSGSGCVEGQGELWSGCLSINKLKARSQAILRHRHTTF